MYTFVCAFFIKYSLNIFIFKNFILIILIIEVICYNQIYQMVVFNVYNLLSLKKYIHMLCE